MDTLVNTIVIIDRLSDVKNGMIKTNLSEQVEPNAEPGVIYDILAKEGLIPEDENLEDNAWNAIVSTTAIDRHYSIAWLKLLNISLLSMVGHGVMGKTTLLQCVRGDEITNEFDLKIWGLDSKKKGGTLGSPLAAKVIGGVLKDNLDERHWRTVLENNLLGQNPINSILKLSYIVLPKHLQNCFAFFVACSYKIMSLIKMT
ncbi:hypothetical protein IEQ34_016600 [Dendrobium chrysotoxum]|uniref:NB-ARC domain-containing protein n=1 Tax=Dendrobium chrysotoxum TaxID=161865 RepID=A0AAV7GDY0_DENCH|nr:hypothetical protein IEQ34_016600 [Dendrobium chrysotoxum]